MTPPLDRSRAASPESEVVAEYREIFLFTYSLSSIDHFKHAMMLMPAFRADVFCVVCARRLPHAVAISVRVQVIEVLFARTFRAHNIDLEARSLAV